MTACTSCEGSWGQSNWAAQTAARVDVVTPSNTTFQDAFQFDPTGTTGCPPPPPYWPCGATGPNWTLTNQNFSFDVKTDINSASLAAQYTSSAGQIAITDAIQRIITMNVPPAVIGLLVPATYIYQLYMFDNSNPPVTVQLMYGNFTVSPGF